MPRLTLKPYGSGAEAVAIDTAGMNRWLAALETRHLADLTFTEAARALRALSSTYVERRERLASRGAFDSAGKRAAYALYYGPLHFLTVQHVVANLDAPRPVTHVLDLGCGAGAAGAAWALAQTPQASVTGVDTNPWAIREAADTYRALGLDGSARRGNAVGYATPRSADAIVCGWMLNELDAAGRRSMQRMLLDARGRRALLIVEPIATSVAPWWTEWSEPFVVAGARIDEWKFRVELPNFVDRLGRAAGLRPDTLSARTLYASALTGTSLAR